MLPKNTRGLKRVDDRRVLSGIVHVLKSGGRWADFPADYGPKKTIYNRFVRWAERGLWENIFAALAGRDEHADRLMIDDVLGPKILIGRLRKVRQECFKECYMQFTRPCSVSA
jgi:transposase